MYKINKSEYFESRIMFKAKTKPNSSCKAYLNQSKTYSNKNNEG